MRVLLINPNTSVEVTGKIKNEAEKFSSDNLEINVIQVSHGPKAIETYCDEMISSQVVVDELLKLEGTYDSAVIACFSDPGLMAARELIKVPVLGIGEASLYLAAMLNNRYSIIASGGKGDIAVFNEIVGKYGLEQKFASVKYLGAGVAGVDINMMDEVESLIYKISEEDGSDCIILGCAAFSGFGFELTRRTGIKVYDGIRQAIFMAKMMCDIGYVNVIEKEDRIVCI